MWKNRRTTSVALERVAVSLAVGVMMLLASSSSLSSSRQDSVGVVVAFTCCPRLSLRKSVASTAMPLSLVGKPPQGRRGLPRMAAAKIPVIEEWKVTRNGAVVGTVLNHPSIPDGDVITTSPLADLDATGENVIVTTQSGSQYKLGTKEGAQSVAKRAKRPTPPPPPPPPPAPKVVEKKAPAPAPAPVVLDWSSMSPQEANRKAKDLYNLNGKSIGFGKYLLAGKSLRSTSGKSNIWTAYAVGPRNGLPSADGTAMPLAIKTSTNKEALSQEYRNYQKVTGGLVFGGQFVKVLDYLPDAGGVGFEAQSALVIERGQMDLKAYVGARLGRGLQGRAMRDAAAAAVQCLQAMHTSNLIWTDLKCENFVVTTLPNNDSDDEAKNQGGLPGVKGIDLESARARNSNPVDYSPEACPPEFAAAFVRGRGADFVLEGSYDIWSLGMMLYELSTGSAYFAKKSPMAITKILRVPDFQADVSAVQDEALRNLIASCLQREPRKRPNIGQVSLHPYFLTSGIGPLSF